MHSPHLGQGLALTVNPTLREGDRQIQEGNLALEEMLMPPLSEQEIMESLLIKLQRQSRATKHASAQNQPFASKQG